MRRACKSKRGRGSITLPPSLHGGTRGNAATAAVTTTAAAAAAATDVAIVVGAAQLSSAMICSARLVPLTTSATTTAILSEALTLRVYQQTTLVPTTSIVLTPVSRIFGQLPLAPVCQPACSRIHSLAFKFIMLTRFRRRRRQRATPRRATLA